jgi:hypothetical protein
MILAVHSDASYLSDANAHSQVGGHFFCSSNVSEPPNNGAVLNISKILKAVMSSAAEAELGALCINASEAVPMRQLLAEMGHKQPKTPIQTDNTTACGSSTTTSNHDAPKPWTCVFTGFVVATPKDNSDTTGVPESITQPTTGQNTTAPLTTSRRGQKS